MLERETAQMDCERARKCWARSEAGSYLWLIDFVYHSTLGLRVIKKKKGWEVWGTDSKGVDEERVA